MIKGSKLSTDRRNCCICGFRTGEYETYTKLNITVEIPICSECAPKTKDVSKLCSEFITKIYKDIKENEKGLMDS